jgi:hypothetical protein
MQEVVMLAKKPSKNQLTLPEAVVTRFGGMEYFDVSTDGECVLRPLKKSCADKVTRQARTWHSQNRQGIEAQTEADGRVIDALQMGGVLGRRSDGPVA